MYGRKREIDRKKIKEKKKENLIEMRNEEIFFEKKKWRETWEEEKWVKVGYKRSWKYEYNNSCLGVGVGFAFLV